MKKGDIIASVIVGIMAIAGLALSIAWQYWFSIIACIICNILYGFVIFCLCRSAYEEKQKIKNAEVIKPDNKKDFDIYVNGMFPCDACGKNPKAQNSQLCKECQDKVSETYKDWW